MSRDLQYQERIAVEYMEYDLCKECVFYKYDEKQQVCLFNSAPIEHCNIIMLMDQADIKKYKD